MWRHAFGHDIFICYARRDAKGYAQALRDALRAKGFDTFLDLEGFKAGSKFRERLRAEVRKSALLLVMASPVALESEHVAFEIAAFAETGRDIIVIRFPETSELPWPAVASRDPAWVQEEPGRLDHGPTLGTIAEIEKHFVVTRSATKRVRLLTSLAAVLLVLLALSIYYGLGFRREGRRANQAAIEAQKAAGDATDAAAEARRQQGLAEERQTTAERQRRRADVATIEATTQRDTAQTQRLRAEQEARRAIARLLVVKAQTISTDRDLAKLLVAEALSRYRAEETDTAFRTIVGLAPVEIKPQPRGVLSLVVAQHSKVSAEAGADGILRITDTTGRLVSRSPHAVGQLVLAPNDTLLVGLGKMGLSIWDLSTRTEQRPLLVPGVAVVAFSTNSQFVAAIGSNGITVWNVVTSTQMWQQELQDDDPSGLAVDSEGQHAFTAVTSETGPRDRERYNSEVVSYSKSERHGIWRCDDCKVRLEGSASDGSLQVHVDNVFNNEDRGRSDVWLDPTSGDVKREIEDDRHQRPGEQPSPSRGETPRPRPPRLVAFSPDSRQLAMGGTAVDAQVCSRAQPSSCRTFRRAEDAQWPFFSPDGTELTAFVSDFVLRRWRIATGDIVDERAIGDPVRAVAYASDGDVTALSTRSNDLLVLRHDKAVGRVSIDLADVPPRLSSDGRRLAAIDSQQRLHLLNVEDRLVERPFGVSRAIDANFGAHDRLWHVDGDGMVRIVDAGTGTSTDVFRPDFRADYVAVSRDERYVALSQRGGATLVWRTKEQQTVARLAFPGPVTFSDDGKFLIGTNSYVILETADMVDVVCSTVKRRLTVADWQSSVGAEPFSPACK